MYKDDLSNSLKMILYRTLIDFPKDDIHIFALMSTGFVINSVVGKLDSSLTSKLPNYGRNLISKVIGLLRNQTGNPMIRY